MEKKIAFHNCLIGRIRDQILSFGNFKVYPSLLFMIVDMVKLQFAMSYYFHFRSICLTSGNRRNLIVISKTYSSFLTKIQKGSQINGIDQHTLNCVAHADCVISP